MNNPYCRLCTSTHRCGRYHLYVIELDYELIKNWKFMLRNKQYRNDMDCLYVGSTSHTCACRFLQHQLHAKKEIDEYICFCDGKRNVKKFVRAGGHTRGSYYPGVYGLRLRPDLFCQLNPIKDQLQAMRMEMQLAEKLRKEGYAVWQH